MGTTETSWCNTDNIWTKQIRFTGNGCLRLGEWNGSHPYLISAILLYICHLHRRESVYRQGDRRIFSHWRPWRCPQKNKLSKRQSDGSQVAYFRDLLIPRWQERVSDVLLASVLFSSGLVSLPSGERGEAWGWDQCDSGMRVQKSFFCFFFPRSRGTLLQQQLFKVLWYFSPLMFIFLFLFFSMLKVNTCHSLKVTVFGEELLKKLTVFCKMHADTHSAALRRRHRCHIKVVFCCFSSTLAWIQLTWLIIVITSHIW